MITNWKLFNFKSVRRETDLEIAPLTIFAGANSSGKSTFIQSILLIAQTMAHKIGSRSVVLNGALTRLGQFEDIKSIDSEANQIVIGWTCKPITDSHSIRSQSLRRRRLHTYYTRGIDSLTSVSCEFAFELDPTNSQREVAQLQPRLFSTQLFITSRDREGADNQSEIIVRRADGDDESKQHWMSAEMENEPLARSSLLYNVILDQTSLDEIHDDFVSAEPIGCLLRHFLPERLTLGVDLVAEDSTIICELLKGEFRRPLSGRLHHERDILVPNEILELIYKIAVDLKIKAADRFIMSRQDSLYDISDDGISMEKLQQILRRLNPRERMGIHRALQDIDGLEKKVFSILGKQRKEEIAVIPYSPISTIMGASEYLDHFYSTSVRYLGPLRDEPRPLYPLTPGVDPSDVGLRGEHTAAVFELHKKRQIQYMPTICFSDPEIRIKRATRSLEAAVMDWLGYLGVAEGVQTRDLGKLGHEIKVSVAEGTKSHDLTHVGVGVSQVLPILIASLMAERDTTLIFEQPELHLHPKVQTLLGDFFLSMTVLGKQCIVETHSEYLINRLRFRTAAAVESNPWISSLKVYFVERTEEGSSFREVAINEYGAVLDWPEGFFDQSQVESEAILRSASIKRKKLRGK